jgi:type I restriction enzyme S subunit
MKQGWEIKKLGEVVNIVNGRNQSAVISESGQYPIYGSAGNLMGYATDYLCEEGTTIIGRKGNISNPIYIEEKFWNVDTAFGLYPKNGYEPKFINYLCQTIDFKIRNRGTTIPSLVKSDLLSIDVPLISSLPEQQRIVSILDEVFAAIAKAKTNAEQNLKNAKELFESCLHGMFEKKDEGWEETSLKSEIDLLSGFAFKSKYYTKNNDDILLIRGDNIMQGYFRWEDVKRWNKNEFEEYKRFQLFENDVVLAMDRPWVKAGLKCSMISKNELPSLLVQRTASLRCKKSIDSSFLFYLVKSTAFTKHLLGVQTGIGVPHISGKQILDFSFNKPPLKEQQTIVRQLDALSAEKQKLEAVYQKKVYDLEELKKSILQRAFNGELAEPVGELSYKTIEV